MQLRRMVTTAFPHGFESLLHTPTIMKVFNKIVIAIMMASGSAAMASAQYYAIANQVSQLIQPALSGSFNYKGYVDVSYLKGLGDRNADIFEITTTQGFRYADWFFMGIGAGVEAMFTNPQHSFDGWDDPEQDSWSIDPSRGRSKTGWLIPLFTDFRFNFGSPKSVGFFLDLRVGATFLVSDNYLEIGDGYMTRSECFYLKPALGLRIPLSDSNPKQALNIGVSYQLTTSRYWYYQSSDLTLNALGVTMGFEW